MPRPPLLLLFAALLSAAARAQDWTPDGLNKIRGAARGAKKAAAESAQTVSPLDRERAMFDASCGGEVNLEKSGALGAAIPRRDQNWIGNCWAYSGCYGLEYSKRRRAGSAPGSEVASCDPVMTSVAVKLGYAQGLPDALDEKGNRKGSFVDSDSFASFPDKLKATRFGRAGQGDLCKARGCYCARATDQDIAGPELLAHYYSARDIVDKHLKKVWERKHTYNLAALTDKTSPDADYDDAGKTVLRIARELDAAGFPGIIRSSLDDGTLARLLALQSMGAAFDNKLAARTILEQSCMPVPVPENFRVVPGPGELDAPERRKIAVDPLSSEDKMRGMFYWINGKLGESTPVMIGFCSSLLNYTSGGPTPNGNYIEPPEAVAEKKTSTSPSGAKGCGNHAVVIVGRKNIGGSCYYGVRNSWGPGKLANPELRYNTPADGTVWIPASLLLQNTFDLGSFE